MSTKIPALLLMLAIINYLPALAADIYVVRHAEKATDMSNDPDLTLIERQRAANLAVVLKSAGIERVFSTDYRRTRETAAPVAALTALELQLYDPKALETLAARLLDLQENTLVVGHSNTTLELVDLMGGEGGPPIVEEWEYDRLYLLQTEHGKVNRTILLHLPPGNEPPSD